MVTVVGGGVVATGTGLILWIVFSCFVATLFEKPKIERRKKEREEQVQNQKDHQRLALIVSQRKERERQERIRRVQEVQTLKTSYGSIADYRAVSRQT